MGFSSKQTSRKDFRSITMPCRSHPSTYRVEKVLNDFKTWESTSSLTNPSADVICSGVSQLVQLYEYLNEIFKTGLSQTSSNSRNQNMKWTDELLDVSVNFMDIFSNTSDLMLQTKQHVRDLACDLRRNGGSSIIDNYIAIRKNLRKDIKRSVACLNQSDNMISPCHLVTDLQNHHLTSMIRVFREVKALTIVILRLLLKFLATPLLKTRSTSRWTTISSYISNHKVVPEEKADKNTNILQLLDSTLLRNRSTSYKPEFNQLVQKKLDEFEVIIDDIYSNLELLTRRLIATRTSLLNFVSFY